MRLNLIDLTHPLTEVTPLFPGDKQMTLTQVKTSGADGYNAFWLSAGLHTGTHVDAPLHMLPNGRTVAETSIARFYGRGVLLDVRGQERIGLRPEYEALVAAGDAVLLYTGFDAYFYSDPERYFHDYPQLDDQLCEFLCQKGVRLLGTDTPSPDYPPYSKHVKLLSHNICLLENLTHLEALAAEPNFTVIALPLRINAEASPVRAVALTFSHN